ncbi:transposase [Saccharothrix sp. NRRL B-16348]|nr:transposase [Saccharothrix sp. NRRL B-16348]
MVAGCVVTTVWWVSSGVERRFTDGISLGVLTRLVDRDLVDEVLAVTGRREKRSRLLPARVVVYYVLALCLFFEDSYEEVMRKLVNGLRFLGTWRDEWRVPTAGAISQARARLGAEPLRVLFDRVAVPMAEPGTKGAWLRGWRVMAVDGVVLDVPDTPANTAVFDRRDDTPFPQVRAVGLAECGTHAIVAAAFETWRVQERELLHRILDRFEPGMLVLADRGFHSYGMWTAAAETGADLLWRVTDTLELPVLEWLPDGSYRSFLLPKHVKGELGRHGSHPLAERSRVPVRVVEYMVTDRGPGDTIRLITTIADPDHAAAAELAALYQQRWEFELTLDEIETHQMPATRLLRSKTPELVEQEIWALLLTHYAVRELMHEAADPLGPDDTTLDVDRLSFTRSLNATRRQVLNQAGFSPSAPDGGDAGDA